jgi:uncharacterized membrane protein HdeD (DUF308 family)
MNANLETNLNAASLGRLMARKWWLITLRGVAGVMFGILAFIWPGITLLTLIWLYSAYALVNGTLAFVLAFSAPKGVRRSGSLIFQGLFSIAVGVIAFLMPGITALALVILIAAWAIVTGIFEIAAAVRLRKVITNEWLLVLAGLLSVGFGVVMLARPAAGAVALVWWIASFTLIFGVLLIALSFRMRHWRTIIPVAAV